MSINFSNSDSVKNTPKSSSQAFVWSKDNKVPGDYSGAKDFSYANLTAYALIPARIAGKVKMAQVHLPNLTLIGLSTHRDTYPVVSSGRRGIKGYTTGHATIAGTLGFTITEEGPFAPLLRAYATYLGNAYYSEKLLPNELPPFDLICIFKDFRSEKGAMVRKVNGIKIIDSSSVTGIDNILLTENYSFMAMNMSELMDFERVVVVQQEKPNYYNQDRISKRASAPRLKLSFSWADGNPLPFDDYDYGFNQDIVDVTDDEETDNYSYGISTIDASLSTSSGSSTAAESAGSADLGSSAPTPIAP